jgi:hypothetical protein
MTYDRAMGKTTSFVIKVGWLGTLIWQMNAGNLCWSAPPTRPTIWAQEGSRFPEVSRVTRAQDFVRGIGVTTHLNVPNSPYSNIDAISKSISYLGISLVRSVPPSSWYQPLNDALTRLAHMGVRINFGFGANQSDDLTQTVPDDIEQVAKFAAANPGKVAAVEGPNELNTQIVRLNGQSSASPQVAAQIQRYIAKQVRANATLMGQGVKIINVSVSDGDSGWSRYTAGLGNLSDACDYANWHVYFGPAQPGRNIANDVTHAQQSAPGKPVIYTESGYTTAKGDSFGVDEATQAKQTLNLLADAWKAGIQQTYVYELTEGVVNPDFNDVEGRFGLFHAGGMNPKPAATAIHNLVSILADTGANALTFTPGTIGYSIDALPITGNSLTIEKSSGVFDVLIWNEAAAGGNVTVRVGRSFATIKVYDPIDSTVPVSTALNAKAVTLPLADKLQVVELTP